MATGDTASDPFSRSAPTRGEEGSLTFNGDTTILTRPQAGRKGDIVEEHGRAPSRDAQIVRPSTPAPVTRCEICQRTVAYRPGSLSEVLTEHYRRAHPEALGAPSQ